MADLKRRPLAPFEKRLCAELGCTEAEYSEFLDAMHSQMVRKPIPGDAITNWEVVTAVIAIIGFIFQVVGLLIRPEPPKPKDRGPMGESASPVYGFTSVQDLARIGEVVPQVYCDRGPESEGRNPAGGIRVNGKLVWSQIESRGNYQEGKFLTILSYGPISEIKPLSTALGKTPLPSLNSTASWVYYIDNNDTTPGPLLQNSTTQHLQVDPQNRVPDPTVRGGSIYWVPKGAERVPGTSQAYTPTTSNTFGITSVIPVENEIRALKIRSDGSEQWVVVTAGITLDATTKVLVKSRGTATRTDAETNPNSLSLTVAKNNIRDEATGAGMARNQRTKAVESFAAGTRYLLGNTVWRAEPFVPSQNANVELNSVTLHFNLTDYFRTGRLSSSSTLGDEWFYMCSAEFASYVSLSRVDALELSIKASVWAEMAAQARDDISHNGNRNRVSAFRVRYRRAGTETYADVSPLFYIDRSTKTETFFYIRLEFPELASWEVQLYPVVDMPLQSVDGLFKIDGNSPQVSIPTTDNPNAQTNNNTLTKCFATGTLYAFDFLSSEAAAYFAGLIRERTRLNNAKEEFTAQKNRSNRNYSYRASSIRGIYGYGTLTQENYDDLIKYKEIANPFRGSFGGSATVIDYDATLAYIDVKLTEVQTEIDKRAPSEELRTGFYQSARWMKGAPYRKEQDARYSFENGPEFTIVAANEIQYVPAATFNSYYLNCALLGLNIFGGRDRQDISQISTFISRGRVVTRYDADSQGLIQTTTGPSNRFGDVFVDTLTSKAAGLGQYITTAMVDTTSIAKANLFTTQNRLYFDGVIDQEISWRQWATETAGHNLLQVVTLNGKFGLLPVVPFNTLTGAIDPLAYTIKGIFNEGNILEGTYNESMQAAEDTLPQVVTIRYRENVFNPTTPDNIGFPRERSVTYKLKNEGTTEDKEALVNCVGGVTTKAQAALIATYLLCARRYEDRVITFKTPEPWLGLAPGDIIRVDTQFTRFINTYAGHIKADGTYDIPGFNGTLPANSKVLVYTPGAERGVLEFDGASFQPSSYPNSLVAIGQNTVEFRLFTITRIDIDEDGVAEIGAKLFPVLAPEGSNNHRPSLIATALLNQDAYVQQIYSDS